MRRVTICLSLLSFAVGMVLFQLKYQVVALEQTQRQLEKSCVTTSEALNVMKAEWEHLNDPQRLQMLADRYLDDLRPVTIKQVVGLRDITSGDIHYDASALDQLIQDVAQDTRELEAG